MTNPDTKLEKVTPLKLAANITDILVPAKDKTYVPFGFYNSLKMIITSKIFYPVYITGLSGNGKTLMVEQVCANADREMVRVNITKETDETDLIGSYELINGNTVRREGPVLVAMRKGAILLLDETDYGSERLLCLQPILEGKPYLDKKTGEVITPTEGFNVIATANTKGKGNDSGNFIGANILNEAFLERFAITVEQQFPDAHVEANILERLYKQYGMKDDGFIGNLVTWADGIRKTYFAGGHSDVISTRRLAHIVRAYHIFKDRKTALELCLNRFDEATKAGFLDLYEKLEDLEAPAKKSSWFKKDPSPKVPDDVVNPPPPAGFGTSPGSPGGNFTAGVGGVGGNFTAGVGGVGGSGGGGVSPTFANAAGFSSPLSQPVAPTNMPSFCTPKILYDICMKYNEKVSLKSDGILMDYVVESHGHETRIAADVVKNVRESVPGYILDQLVESNRGKKNNQYNPSFRPFI